MTEPMPASAADEPESRPGGIPLYVWVVISAVLAIPVGLAWGPGAVALKILPDLIIRALTALAAPLVVLAILSAIVTNDIRGRQGARMMAYYLTNTVVAITIALVLANMIRPGEGADLSSAPTSTTAAAPEPKGLLQILDELVPRSLGEALATNNIAQLVLVAVALGIALAKIRNAQRARGETTHEPLIHAIAVGFEALMRVLLWVVALVPLAVFGVVAVNVGQKGLSAFVDLGWFVIVVLVGLACQVAWYLGLLTVFARMSPWRFLRGASNVMAMTFSTASTGATIPVTLKALTGRLGVSRGSSQLAACVGTNFNNDGTALYQAAVVLFIAQALGRTLSLPEQLIVVITTVLASIGAGCIPSGGFVTLPLIFAAVGLPAEQLPFILTVDWFLDRCRTTSNVLGDMTVAVLLDQTADPAATEPEPVEPELAIPEGVP